MTALRQIADKDETGHASVAGVNLSALADYIERERPGILAGPLQVRLLGGGRSNPTYELRDGVHSWVLRRPPLGHVLPSAHNMQREYRVIRALHGTPVPVPETLLLCDDAALIGASFYIMEKVDGRNILTPEDAAELTMDQRRELGFSLADTLAELHSIDPAMVGLSDFGRPEGFMERQLRRWSQQWMSSRLMELPEVDRLLEALGRNVPELAAPGIVHGDVKIDNLLVEHGNPGRIAAVLDWEMSTLGDTFADIGVLLSFWDEPGGVLHPVTKGMTALPGFPTRAEMIERYTAHRGLESMETDWYLVFADLKVAVILEGIAARHRNGQTVGGGFDDIGGMVKPLLDRAAAVAAGSPAIRY
jgi:aminoglycoside phosphotransferase (APT) family kinase protein